MIQHDSTNNGVIARPRLHRQRLHQTTRSPNKETRHGRTGGTVPAGLMDWKENWLRDLMIALINSDYFHMAGTVEQQKASFGSELCYPQETNNIDPKCRAPYSLYGDESTIFRTSCMILHWHPTLSPKNTNSLLSRFLLCIVPADKYWVVHWLCKVAVCSL